MFPLISYELGDNGERIRVLGNRIIPTDVIFTMNANDHFYEAMNYASTLGSTTHSLQYLFGYDEQLHIQGWVTIYNIFDAAEKQRRHETQFPMD